MVGRWLKGMARHAPRHSAGSVSELAESKNLDHATKAQNDRLLVRRMTTNVVPPLRLRGGWVGLRGFGVADGS